MNPSPVSSLPGSIPQKRNKAFCSDMMDLT